MITMNNSAIFVQITTSFMARTQEEINARQRELRKIDGNKNTKKYLKTKRGFLMDKYRHMMGRVEGHSYYLGVHMWAGKEILPKETFYEWAMAQTEFHKLYDEWVASGYERKLCPSVDRIKGELGYIIGNMEFVTFSVNCQRGSAVARKNYLARSLTVR